MRKIQQLIQVLLGACFLYSFSACNTNEVEVVQQDTSWQMDRKYIEEDIREQLGIDPFTNLAYLGYYDSPYLQINAKNDLSNTTIPNGTEYSVKVKLSNVYKENVTVSLVKDDNLMSQFPEKVEGISIFPEDTYSLEPAIVKAGETEAVFKITFKNLNKLNNNKGYVMALKLQIEGTHQNLQVAKTRVNYFVRMRVEIQLDNVDSSNMPIEGTLFNSNLTFESNIRPDKLGSLKDGDLTVNKWYTSTEASYLDIIIPEKTSIKGLLLHTTSGYALKGCDVLVEENGEWVNNGAFEISAKSLACYVKFKKPVECTKIRLIKIKQFSGKYTTDINEVALIQ
ncbi:DUF1735 domain-containing protein [Macellibacteroides fermentans]|uniref:BT-3987-like N-terminal domain-containing protein n=1 Tax=Macellibacteroides fermentans TaxID=879969 RepID=A0A8E2D4P0_9PORP|nr:DUF1735 domain-containing protein [Macellibacteroides fermentans]NYI49043.1 hypothetical protein [Macellibacteroides fermentans]